MNIAGKRRLSHIATTLVQGTLKLLLTGHGALVEDGQNRLLPQRFAHEYLFTTVNNYSSIIRTAAALVKKKVEVLLTTAAMRNAGSDWAELGISEEMDIVAFISGAVDQQLSAAIVVQIENIQDRPESRIVQGIALEFGRAHLSGCAYIRRINCKFRLHAKPCVHQEGSFAAER